MILSLLKWGLLNMLIIELKKLEDSYLYTFERKSKKHVLKTESKPKTSPLAGKVNPLSLSHCHGRENQEPS